MTPEIEGTLVADRYLLQAELGRGGMATVWRARDQQHHRDVAIKVLHPELAGALGAERFVREVRLTAQLQHPNIVPILDSGVLHAPDGMALPWYAMAFLEGESLRSRLEREPQHQLPIDEAIAITEAVGSALEAAHRQGIAHRDIKPENVFLSENRVFVVDFGIAKALLSTGGERLTSTGLSIGTPAYMSPEQATGEVVDARTDQYSLATVLYEMLAGEPPFAGSTPQATLARRLAEPARPLRPVRPRVPEQLERGILRALERSPADRFTDVAAFTTAIRAAAAEAPPVTRRSRLRPILAAVVVVALLLTGWLVLSNSRRTTGSPRDAATVALYQRGLREYDRRTPAGTVEAVSAFSAAVARDSSFAEAWNGLARSYVRAYTRTFAIPGLSHDNQLRSAVAAADRALALDSSSADAWVTRAQVARLVDPTDMGPTLRAARRAVELDSASAIGWHTLAGAQADGGNIDEAFQSRRQCVRVAPRYTECLAFLGLMHYWRRQYDSAAAWADSAVAVDPSYLLARQVSGDVAMEQGKFDRAEAAYEAARRLVTDVEVANSLAGIARAQARTGRMREARATLKSADSLAAAYHPAPLHTMIFLAGAHVALGEPDRGVTLLGSYQPRRDLHFQKHLHCDPPLDGLRANPAFQVLLVAHNPVAKC